MSKKILCTKNYRMFSRNDENRPTDVKKHRKLVESMKRYGFLQSFPIVCFRDEKGNLIIKDGQHRYTIAETLDLPIYWVEEDVDFDIATINCTAKVWQPRDYAEKFAMNGKKDYQEGLEFAKNHGLSIGPAFALLAGTTTFSNIDQAFYLGQFKVKDRKWADAVAEIYSRIAAMSPCVKNQHFISACMAVCRVDGFSSQRLLESAERCRDKLVAYYTRDAYLQMLQDIYNFHRKNLVALKIEAEKVMRERNATEKAKEKKRQRKQLEEVGAA